MKLHWTCLKHVWIISNFRFGGIIFTLECITAIVFIVRYDEGRILYILFVFMFLCNFLVMEMSSVIWVLLWETLSVYLLFSRQISWKVFLLLLIIIIFFSNFLNCIVKCVFILLKYKMHIFIEMYFDWKQNKNWKEILLCSSSIFLKDCLCYCFSKCSW